MLTPLEASILDALLQGDVPQLETLRIQAGQLKIRARRFTGVGFFTDFDVPADLPRLTGDGNVGDVGADVAAVKDGAGFVLFVKGGALSCLEGFVYTGQWPADAVLVRRYFLRPKTAGSSSLVESVGRDMEFALEHLPA